MATTADRSGNSPAKGPEEHKKSKQEVLAEKLDEIITNTST